MLPLKRTMEIPQKKLSMSLQKVLAKNKKYTKHFEDAILFSVCYFYWLLWQE